MWYFIQKLAQNIECSKLKKINCTCHEENTARETYHLSTIILIVLFRNNLTRWVHDNFFLNSGHLGYDGVVFRDILRFLFYLGT